MDIRITDYELTCAAGQNIAQVRDAIGAYRSGLRPNDLPGSDIDTVIGRVAGVESVEHLGPWQSRNNALAALGYSQGELANAVSRLISQYGADRIGIVVGSSTSSIDRTETAYHHLSGAGQLQGDYCQPNVHNPHAPGLFLANLTGITGPVITINTACSSSAKVFATGARWLAAGLVDAVLVAGIDSLCLTVVHGFHSLQLVASAPCRPFDQQRAGTNLGEAAAFAILQPASAVDAAHPSLRLSGYGESSDAHHMSHPHPEGLGARLAIEQALGMAHLKPADIDYVNLHGTSTRANDLVEGQLVQTLFSSTDANKTVFSSTKAWMGHTLGAAGIVEAVIALDALASGLAPGSLNLHQLDEALDFNIKAENQPLAMQHVMSNSFGFGGNNCCLVFSKVS